jgi:putative ABC transport system substrate-binding protein
MTAARRLAAIFAADVVGYSRLMGADDEGTLKRLKAIRAELVDPTIAAHRGRIFKTMGDGLLVEFGSVVDAVQCAVVIQRDMKERDTGDGIAFRIGVNVGDVIIDGDDIYGDGVNIAARLEALAEPGGICVSARVHEDSASRVDAAFEDLGEQALKNISRAVRVYRVRTASEAMATQPTPPPSSPLHAEPETTAPSSAQKMRSIGYLGVEPRGVIEEFRRRLATYGHVEGQTLQTHYRWSGGVYAGYPDMVRELIDLGVELIVAVATPALAAAKQATSTIPIVMVEVGDPVGYGIVPSLMRPDGNITGMSHAQHEFAPRGLRLLKEIVPDAIRVALLAPANSPGINAVASARQTWEEVIQALGMIPRTYYVGSPEEIRAALAGLDRRNCDLLVVVSDHGLVANRSIVIAAATALKIPVFCPSPAYVRDGGLLALSPDLTEVHRRLAYYVDAILKGTPPSALPIEEPTKWTLQINLKTAKTLGITIPAPILMRADELIE